MRVNFITLIIKNFTLLIIVKIIIPETNWSSYGQVYKTESINVAKFLNDL